MKIESEAIVRNRGAAPQLDQIAAINDRHAGITAPPVRLLPTNLEPAALVVEPRLAEWRGRLGDATGRTPVLAGSGSTWFVEGAYPDAGGVIATVVRQ